MTATCSVLLTPSFQLESSRQHLVNTARRFGLGDGHSDYDFKRQHQVISAEIGEIRREQEILQGLIAKIELAVSENGINEEDGLTRYIDAQPFE